MSERIKEDFNKYYDILNVIGHSAYGLVYKGKEKQTNELRAIKVIDLDKIRANLMNQYEGEELEKHVQSCVDGFITEYNNMKICCDNNINSVKCYEYFNNKKNFVIIMDLCPNPQLKKLFYLN